MASTLTPASRAAATSSWPGSEIPGMPASETRAKFFPSSISETRRGVFILLLCSW